MKNLYALVQFVLYERFPLLYKWLYFLYKRISDRERFTWIKENIKEGMIVLEVGANIGDYVPFLSKLVGETGKVYAFEPDPKNFEYMKRFSGHLKNVELVHAAVGEKDGEISLFQSDTLNVDHQTYDSGESRKSIKIRCVSLDSFLKNHAVDLIKIDIQGYDFIAIRGAKQILKENKNISVIGEYWPYGLNKAGNAPKEYLEFLKELGFTINIPPEALIDEKILDKEYYTDFIATKHGN